MLINPEFSEKKMKQMSRPCEKCGNNICLKDIALAIEKVGFYNCSGCGLQLAQSLSTMIEKQTLHERDPSFNSKAPDHIELEVERNTYQEQHDHLRKFT